MDGPAPVRRARASAGRRYLHKTNVGLVESSRESCDGVG